MYIQIEETQTSSESFEIWDQRKLKEALVKAGVWPASIPGNVESWYPIVLEHVIRGDFSFKRFVSAFTTNTMCFREVMWTLPIAGQQPTPGVKDELDVT